MEDYTYDIGKLKRAALERGWTQYRVAKEAGVSAVTVGKLFRGDNEFYPIEGGRYYIPASGSVMRFHASFRRKSCA